MDLQLAELYRDARLRIAGLVNNDIADLPVSATPAWTIHDVVAHVLGIVVDTRTNNMDGAPSDAWTAAQVERSKGKSVEELLVEWEHEAVAFEDFLSTPAGQARWRVAADANSHYADIKTALGQPVSLPTPFLEWVLPRLTTHFETSTQERGLPPITVDISDFEYVRSRFGRRSRDEVLAYSWSHDPEPYLESWFIFGPAAASIGEREAAT